MTFRRNSKQTGSFMMSTSGRTYETQEDAIVSDEINSSQTNLVPNEEPVQKYRRFFVVCLMCVINLVNYCDRYTLASELIYLIFT